MPNDAMRKRTILKRLYQLQDGLCFYCGLAVDFNQAPPREGGKTGELYPTLDHIIPTAKGGSGEMSNLAMACYKCNHPKGDYLFPELLMKEHSLRNRLFRSGMIKRFFV